ncbi:MAG: hypothetical protein HY552_06220 [Elusimicrobia bacterium]|nr:hypothetical protein [Elusimicrobiota bacterium]
MSDSALLDAALEPLAAACAVPVGRLAEDAALRELLLRALREARAAAGLPAAKDAKLQAGALAACRAAPNRRGAMLRDLKAGRRTNIRALLGPLLTSARRRKVPVPTLDLLAAAIGRLERRPAR